MEDKSFPYELTDTEVNIVFKALEARRRVIYTKMSYTKKTCSEGLFSQKVYDQQIPRLTAEDEAIRKIEHTFGKIGEDYNGSIE